MLLLEFIRYMSGLQKEHWGKNSSGDNIDLYTLRNAGGVSAQITTFGGRLVSLTAPDRHGRCADIVLGFDDLAGYLGSNPYFGALVGRYANRIAKGEFSLDGKQYSLVRNSGENALHGGTHGFDKVVWEAAEETSGATPSLHLHYFSAAGEEGYPGTLDVHVRYTLSDDNELRINYRATTDSHTVLNLTNHSYFDLSGVGSGKILDCVVTIHANRFTPVNAHLIPTGELRAVAGTPFDFRQPAVIGSRIDDGGEQLKYGAGYDHNFVLNGNGNALSLAAKAVDPHSGRVLEVLTTQPGIQFYTGNHLDGSVKGKGCTYGPRTGMCFETQHFPDSPNQPEFPSTELKAGSEYQVTTVFRLGTE